MDNKKHNKVFGLGWCIDCGRIFVFDAIDFTLIDSSVCRDCSNKIDGLRELDGLPPKGEPDFKKTYN